MENVLEPVADVVTTSTTAIIETGVIGAILVLSLLANGFLVWALVRAYRWTSGNSGGQL